MGRSHLVDVLSVLFGIGTWVVVNGFWVELPLLVQALPEGWKLPSYLTIIVQLANIAPVLYTVLHSLFPRTITDSRAIYFIIGLGLLANALLVFYWDTTGYVLGEMRSTALLGLTFCLAMVDTSSRVLYLPFMARFQSIYLTSFFIGEGLSGLVPSIFALIQGVGGNPECRLVNVTTGNVTEEELQAFYPDPLFSIEVFFVLLFLTVLISLIAFHMLTLDGLTYKALATPSANYSPRVGLTFDLPTPIYQSTSVSNSMENVDESFGKSGPITMANISSTGNVEVVGVNNSKTPLFQHLPKPVFIYLLLVQGVVCALANGCFPSIQSYSSLPYGNVAYHLSATLSTIANPAVCFLLFILPKPTKFSITSVLFAAFGVGSYVMATAVKSPTPPLVGETGGEVLLVLGWILLVGCFTYVKVSIATMIRAEGKRGLFWYGAITQLGSASGALITFLVVNLTTIFEGFEACQEGNLTTTQTGIKNLII